MRNLLIIFTVLFSVSAMAKEGQFSLLFSCSHEKSKFCINGKIPAETVVTLLPETGSEVCTGKAWKSFKYIDRTVGVEFEATGLKDLKGCKEPDDYFAVVLGQRVVDFDHLKPKHQADIKSLLAEAKEKKILESVLEKSKQYIKYKKEVIQEEKPEVSTYEVGERSLTLVQFPLDFRKNGPLFSYTKEGFQSLADVCSQPLKVFQVNSQPYVFSGPSCCECGWYEKKIFELGSNQFSEVYSNHDWSN